MPRMNSMLRTARQFDFRGVGQSFEVDICQLFSLCSELLGARHLTRARNEDNAAKGIAVVTTPENRWARVDIKTVGLLPNVLARQGARERGAYEAWFVDAKGFITEGSSSNAWIVTRDGRVVTRPADHGILSGITRAVLFDVLEALQLKLEERPFTLDDVGQATEAFVTSASQIVMQLGIAVT